MSEEISKEMRLRQLYYDEGLFPSLEHLYQASQRENLDVSRKEIQQWLQHQEVYSQHKRMPGIKKYRKTRVYHLGQQVQIDLVLMQRFEDDGYQYILVMIEVLSRFAFATPLKRKIAESTKKGLEDLLEDFQEHFGDYPDSIQFDQGGEFKNKKVTGLLDSLDIHYFWTPSDRKASLVERLNRSLQEKIRKIWKVEGNQEWVRHLSDVLESYNARKHRVLGMSPKEVNTANQFTVWGRQFGRATTLPRPKFQVGDQVRVYHFKLMYRTTPRFRKYYREKYGEEGKTHMVEEKRVSPFSEEVFQIRQVVPTQDGFYVYRLSTTQMRGKQESILGMFYPNELSLYKG